MLIRALIVLLIVLNLGVAAWWLARPVLPVRELAVQPEGVPRLELLDEKRAVLEAPSATAQDAADSGASACFSLGPFASEAAAAGAMNRLRNVAALTRTRTVPASGASAYNVFLPPAGDRAQAQESAGRIAAAGFDDFLVVNSGELANAVALGRYGSFEVAQRRQAALQAAGFPAQVNAVGASTPAQWWLDARAPEEFTPERAQALVGAAGSQELDCALLL
jgi:hypothetical protein